MVKNCDGGPQAEGSIFKPEVTDFHHTLSQLVKPPKALFSLATQA